MRRDEFLRRVGNMEQVAGIAERVEGDGRKAGQRVYTVDNGVLRFDLWADRALDIGTLAFKGQNIAYLSKPGLDGKSSLDAGLRSIAGGMMFTCGLRNVGPPDTADDAMHGRIRTTPAEHVAPHAFWRGDSYRLEVSGEVREAALFGENLLLRRTVTTKLGSHYFRVYDEIENQAFEISPFMLLYHINIGYPLLDVGTVLHVPAYLTEPRDQAAESGLASWSQMTAPADHCPEQVFYHRLCADEEGMTLVAVVNRARDLALWLRYNVEQLPVLCEWKSMQSGDYVLGVEPANCVPEGRARVQQRGMLRSLQPLESAALQWQLGFAEGAEIDALIAEIDQLQRTGARS